MCDHLRRWQNRMPSQEHQRLGQANRLFPELLELTVRHQKQKTHARPLLLPRTKPGTAGFPSPSSGLIATSNSSPPRLPGAAITSSPPGFPATTAS